MKIRSFEISLEKGIQKTSQTNISKVTAKEEPRKKRKYTPKSRIIYGPYLEKMFYNNELARYTKTQRDDKTLRYDFLYDYRRNYDLKRRFAQYKETIGTFRTKYNKRELHSEQKPVFLLSLCYSDIGNPCPSMKEWYKNLSFEEAYRKCLDYKIGDPRFIPPELLERLRERKLNEDPDWIDWQVPTEDWLTKFEQKIGMEPYNSVHFPPGWKREDTPIDSDL